MNSGDKAICWIVALVVFGLISLAGLLTIYEVTVDTTALKNGYSEITLPGNQGTHWVKE